jgi:hypothetical protein
MQDGMDDLGLAAAVLVCVTLALVGGALFWALS